MGGADGFVGILGAGFGLESVELSVIILVAVTVTDKISGGSHGLVRKAQGVGTHVGDQTQSAFALHVHAFVQLLCHSHGALGGEAQLPGSLLLEGGSGEGRCSGALLLGLLDVGDGELLVLHVIDDGLGLGFVLQLPLLVLAPVVGLEGTGLADAVQLDVQGPVLSGDESTDLVLTVHHQTGGHGLDTACGQAPADLLPQQGGQLVAHDAVQDASCLLGIHQVVVDVTGACDGFTDHLLGDLVKGNTVGLLVGQAQQLFQMPGDGFALPVRVSCKVDRVYLRRCILQFPDQILLAPDGDVVGIEITFQVHTHGGLGQVPQMAHAGLDGVIGTQVFANGLRLGGGLHDDQIARFAHE